MILSGINGAVARPMQTADVGYVSSSIIDNANSNTLAPPSSSIEPAAPLPLPPPTSHPLPKFKLSHKSFKKLKRMKSTSSENQTPLERQAIDAIYRKDPDTLLKLLECPICLELIDSYTLAITECGHVFHDSCLGSIPFRHWSNTQDSVFHHMGPEVISILRKCPMCRSNAGSLSDASARCSVIKDVCQVLERKWKFSFSTHAQSIDSRNEVALVISNEKSRQPAQLDRIQQVIFLWTDGPLFPLLCLVGIFIKKCFYDQ